MAKQQDSNQQVWRGAIITVALAACLIFGAAILASGDWVPGGIIVAASAVGLAREVPMIWRLWSGGYPPSPPKHKAVK